MHFGVGRIFKSHGGFVIYGRICQSEACDFCCTAVNVV